MEIVADRWEPASLFIVSGMLGASPFVAGTGSGRRTPYWTAPDKKRLWGTRVGTFFCPAHPKSLWRTLWRDADGDAIRDQGNKVKSVPGDDVLVARPIPAGEPVAAPPRIVAPPDCHVSASARPSGVVR